MADWAYGLASLGMGGTSVVLVLDGFLLLGIVACFLLIVMEMTFQYLESPG